MICEAILKIKSDAQVSVSGSNIDTCTITWHDGNPTSITKDHKIIKTDGTVTSQKDTGGANNIYLIVGFDYSLSEQFSIGSEIRYALGSYKQDISDASGTAIEQSISLAGPQILFNINYLLSDAN